MVNAALKSGQLKEGGLVVEATAGNTGVGLAHVCRAKGLRCIFICPDHVSDEKVNHLKLLGAEDVIRCPRLPPTDPMNYQNRAKNLAKELGGVCLDQYNNLNNMTAHIESTGPELWRQTDTKIDCVVLSSGTGGTIAGVSTYLKSKNPAIQIYLVDIVGAGVTLRGNVEESILQKANLKYTETIREKLPEEKEDQYTVMEGIGSSVIYDNLSKAHVDGIVNVSDEAGVQMANYMLKYEGIFVGGSSGINLCGAYLVSKKLPPGSRIVTFLCDNGSRYASKLFNETWIQEKSFDISEKKLKDLSFLEELSELNKPLFS